MKTTPFSVYHSYHKLIGLLFLPEGFVKLGLKCAYGVILLLYYLFVQQLLKPLLEIIRLIIKG